MSDNNVVEVLEDKALKLLASDPVTAVHVSKLTKTIAEKELSSGEVDVSGLNLNQITEVIGREEEAASFIFKLFPELNFVADLVSTLVLTELGVNNYKVRFDLKTTELPAEVIGDINGLLTDYMEEEYEITDSLYDIVYDCLYRTGSYVEAILPENVLDDIIAGRVVSTVSLEEDKELMKKLDASTGKGILGSPLDNLGLEEEEKDIIGAMEDFTSFTVTDNWDILKKPLVDKVIRSSAVLDAMGGLNDVVALEDDFLMRTPTEETKADIIHVEDLHLRNPVGKPGIIKFNSGTVVPVHEKGRPENLIGVLILLDGDNAAVDTEESDDFSNFILRDGSTEFQKGKNEELSEAAVRLGVLTEKDEPLDESTVQAFSEIFNRDILTRLKNGLPGDNLAVGGSQYLYTVMLHRALENMETKILYLPEQLVQYHALEYRDNGVGKSLIGDLVILASMKASLLMSGFENEISNNIQTDLVRIKIDDKDRRPEKTLATIKNLTLQLKEKNMSRWSLNPAEINDWLRSRGTRFQIEAHPRLPDTTIEYDKVETSKPTRDDSEPIIDKITKSMIFQMGMHPEIMDNIYEAKFASVAESTRIFTERRSLRRKTTLMKHTTSKTRKIIRADGKLRKALVEIFDKRERLLNKTVFKDTTKKYKDSEDDDHNDCVNYLIAHVIKGVRTTLPSQRSEDDEILAKEFSAYKERLEDRVQVLLGEDEASILGEAEDDREILLSLWKTKLLRQWCADNNYMTEVDDLIRTDSLDEPLVDIKVMTTDYLEKFVGPTLDMLKVLVKAKRKNDARIEKLEAEPEEETEGDELEATPGGDGVGDGTLTEEPDSTEDGTGDDLEPDATEDDADPDASTDDDTDDTTETEDEEPDASADNAEDEFTEEPDATEE